MHTLAPSTTVPPATTTTSTTLPAGCSTGAAQLDAITVLRGDVKALRAAG